MAAVTDGDRNAHRDVDFGDSRSPNALPGVFGQ